MIANMQIRPERAEDHGLIDGVVGRAFGSDAEPELVRRIRASPEYLPDLALVAILREAIVGHVMISGATLRTPTNVTTGRPIVMLSPLAVEPDHQGGGIGGELVRAVTSAASAAGHPFVVLEGSPVYYSRFGFEPAATFGVTMPLPDWAPVEAAQLLRLERFDASGLTDGGQVVYPAAFDALE